MSEQHPGESMEGQVSGPGVDAGQVGQRNIRLRLDESNVTTFYTNAFRTQATAEELSLDLGINTLRPAADQPGTIEVSFEASHRMMMNFYTAKRLAIALSRIVRTYEERFGELEIDPRKRAGGGGPIQPPMDGGA